MNVNQLRKAIKVAKAESKVIYIAIHNSRFHIDFNNCKYRIDGTNELLIINDSFLGDTIIYFNSIKVRLEHYYLYNFADL